MDKLIKIDELVLNPANPRTITEFMQDKLTQSLLLSPWMMAIKPMQVDSDGVIWSGNARCTSLRQILTMDEESIEDMLSQQTVYRNMEEEAQKNLLKYWKKWQKKPEVPCRLLENFSESEKRELLIKDNLHVGEDDTEMLRKFFDRDLIQDFFGTVSWDLYDYADKINDGGAGINANKLKLFKCGYVEFYLTDSEYDKLVELAEKFKSEHGDSLEGFLAYILGDNELLESILESKYYEESGDDNINTEESSEEE